MCDTFTCVIHSYVWCIHMCDAFICVMHSYVWYVHMCDTFICDFLTCNMQRQPTIRCYHASSSDCIYVYDAFIGDFLTSDVQRQPTIRCYHPASNECTLKHSYVWYIHRRILDVLQRTATHCNTLQHTATHCNTLQHTATHCIDLHGVSPRVQPYIISLCCRVLQCVAVTPRVQSHHVWRDGAICWFCCCPCSRVQCTHVLISCNAKNSEVPYGTRGQETRL